MLKRKADPDDESQIAFEEFKAIIKRFGDHMSSKDQKLMLKVFPGSQSKVKGPIVNVARIYDQDIFSTMQKIYDQV